ncbi:hypothetical protein KC19_2G018200 [Ceratodon purpureus]|uniref:Uncharacterized protein n=2 Tax=Ceratodon purpureus TaxID=3225 RepID=A0A8T0IRV1_CERPU|nr:hypothetical protein KC19_2G018200 [Ceratodon purpureus]
MERSGRTGTLLAVKRGLYDTLVAENSRRNAGTMKTSMRGSKSPTKADHSMKHSTMPMSPDQMGRGSTMPLSYLNYRDTERYSHSGRGNSVNFLQKNRQACSRTGNSAAGLSPLRSKIGQAPMIGDALGTPSNRGSSSFMSAGHNGVRDPEFKVGFKKREHNF